MLGLTEIVAASATEPSGLSSQRQATAMGSTSKVPTLPRTRSRMAQNETATPTKVRARTGKATGISRQPSSSAADLSTNQITEAVCSSRPEMGTSDTPKVGE